MRPAEGGSHLGWSGPGLTWKPSHRPLVAGSPPPEGCGAARWSVEGDVAPPVAVSACAPFLPSSHLVSDPTVCELS